MPFDTPQIKLLNTLVTITVKKRFQEVECTRLAEIAFIAHDRYGLTKDTVKRILNEVLNSDQYWVDYSRLLNDCVKCVWGKSK